MSDAKKPPQSRLEIPVPPIVYVLILCVFVLPVAAGLAVVVTDVSIDRLLMEFLLGTWPNQEYPGLSAEDFRDDSTLAAGVALRAFIVFGIPAILGVGIALLLRGVEKRLARMNMRDYTAYRDKFIHTVLYSKFKGPMTEGKSMELGDIDSLISESLEVADGKWRRAEAEILASAINEIQLPDTESF